MFMQLAGARLELVQGNIVDQAVDAIVNAANRHLRGGSGVDGAIHAAGGPELMQELRENYPEGCPTGSAVATTAGKLRARFVFHAVGPVWQGGLKEEPKLLAAAHRRCLELALEHRCTSIAFPAISTGVYGYPRDLAAGTALQSVREFLKENRGPQLVRFVLFDGGSFGAFARVLEALIDARDDRQFDSQRGTTEA